MVFIWEWWTDEWKNLDVLGGYQDHQFNTNLGLYLTSYFSIWTETLYDGENIHSVKLTNKVFLSMLNLHPFFVVGQPKTIDYLKHGFKTFNDFWDEIMMMSLTINSECRKYRPH